MYQKNNNFKEKNSFLDQNEEIAFNLGLNVGILALIIFFFKQIFLKFLTFFLKLLPYLCLALFLFLSFKFFKKNNDDNDFKHNQQVNLLNQKNKLLEEQLIKESNNLSQANQFIFECKDYLINVQTQLLELEKILNQSSSTSSNNNYSGECVSAINFKNTFDTLGKIGNCLNEGLGQISQNINRSILPVTANILGLPSF